MPKSGTVNFIGAKKLRLLILTLSGIVLFGVAGCGETTRAAKLDPTLIPELRGQIRTDKKVYETGEDIVVDYWLTNISDEMLQVEVMDGSRSDDIPFQTYSFDARAPETSSLHLKLKEAGSPLQGTLAMKPGERKKFVQNVFTSRRSGPYVLSLDLRWTDGKRVPFTPITIGVRSKDTGAPSVPPELQQAISQIGASEMEARVQARETILRHGVPAVPLLVALLADEDENVRLAAMDLLARFGRDALPELNLHSTDEDGAVRKRIVYVLAKIGELETVPILTSRLLGDQDKEVRRAALEPLTEHFGNEIVIPRLILALYDEDRDMRQEVFRRLRERSRKELEFPVDAPVHEREVAINRWRIWWRDIDPQAFNRLAPYSPDVRRD